MPDQISDSGNGITSVENVTLGQNKFAFIESPGKLTIYDQEKKQCLDLYGNLDNASIKKDLVEHFEKEPLSVGRIDVSYYINAQKEKNAIYKDIARTERVDKPVSDAVLQKAAQADQKPAQSYEKQIELAQKTGYVQGVCECVGIVSNYDQNIGKKLLSEMNVTKDMAKKFANPKTYETLENTVFAQKQEQKIEQAHSIRR